MTRSALTLGALATVVMVATAHSILRAPERSVVLVDSPSPALTSSTSPERDVLLYGRVSTDDGTIYEGRLRWAGDEEALWSQYFNGRKKLNPWVAYVREAQLPTERIAFAPFGNEVVGWDRRVDLGRPFMARFGDIARVEPRGRRLFVTLRSGTEFELDRFASDDVADGLRVWDGSRGVVDIGEWAIRSIEFLAGAGPSGAAAPLYGTVHTREGEFTGLIQWDREQSLEADMLSGDGSDGPVSLRFEDIASIERRIDDGSLVRLLDGSEITLSGNREVGAGNRGIYVDDARYGRVLVSWDAFERLDFSRGGSGLAYGDFPTGRPLAGSVTTRAGRRLTGRLVYDLDESETTETLDAPSQGVDYTIFFDLIASIERPRVGDDGQQTARVTLRSGEGLRLENAGDLGERNAGMLVFADEAESPEYVPWAQVARVDFAGSLGLPESSGLRDRP